MTRVSVVLAVAAVCAAGGSAAPAPTGKIVFSSASGVGGKTQIWVMNANGSRRHSLSPATVYEEGPALSRDGRRIAFGRRGEIYVMSSSGSNVHRLTFSPAQEGAPAWSSDGRWIAYSSYRSGKSDIWKMRSDGSAKTRLTRTASLEDVPDWSPDGRRIVYAGPQARIWVMKADGSEQHPLTRNALGGGVAWAPAWSPRGTLIAYEFSGGTSPVEPNQRDLADERGWLAPGAADEQPARGRPADLVAGRSLARLRERPPSPRPTPPLGDAPERQGPAPSELLGRRGVPAILV